MSDINQKNNINYIRKIFKIDLIFIPSIIISFLFIYMFSLFFLFKNQKIDLIDNAEKMQQQIEEIINNIENSSFLTFFLPFLLLFFIISLITCFAYKIFIYNKIQTKNFEFMIFKQLILIDILSIIAILILFIITNSIIFSTCFITTFLLNVSYKIFLISKINIINPIIEVMKKIFTISIIKYCLIILINFIANDSVKILISVSFIILHIYEIIILINDLNHKNIQKNLDEINN